MISTAQYAHDCTAEAAMQAVSECYGCSGSGASPLKFPSRVSPTRGQRRAGTPPMANAERAPGVKNSMVQRTGTPRVHSLPDSESRDSTNVSSQTAAVDSRPRWMRNSSVSSSSSASSSESIGLCSPEGSKSRSCPPSRSSTPNKRQEPRLPPCLPAVAMEVGAVHTGTHSSGCSSGCLAGHCAAGACSSSSTSSVGSNRSFVFPSSAAESHVSLFHESASVSSASTFSSRHTSPANSRSSSLGRQECDWSASHCPCLGDAVLASGKLRRTQAAAAAAAATPHSRQTGAILRLHGRKFREISVSPAPLRAVIVGAQLHGKVQPGQVIFVVPVGLHECIDGELTVVAVERGNHEVTALIKDKAGQCCADARGKDDVSPSQQPVDGCEGTRGSIEGKKVRAPTPLAPKKTACRQRQCVEMMVTAFLSKGGKEGMGAGCGTGAVAMAHHPCRVSVSNTWSHVREGRLRWSKLFTVSTPPPADQAAAAPHPIAAPPPVMLPQQAVC